MNEGDPIDQNIIERYIDGDKSALALLVKRWHYVFCQKAYWVLQDKDLSKDVAQECWIIIINKLHTLKNTDSFRPWALRIIYTKSIDAHKRRTRAGQNQHNINRDIYMESDNGVDRTVIKQQLLQAIQGLSERQQDIIRLFYVEDYSLKEISSFLQIPVGTVKSRLFKAREKLKSSLKSNNHEK